MLTQTARIIFGCYNTNLPSLCHPSVSLFCFYVIYITDTLGIALTIVWTLVGVLSQPELTL